MLTRTHIRNGFLAGLALGLAALATADRFQPYENHIGAFAVLGIFLIAVVRVSAPLIFARAWKLHDEKRFAELNRQVQSGGSAEIRGGSGVIRLLLLLWLAEIAIFETSKGADAGTMVTLAGAGVAFLTLGFLEALTVIPLLSQPTLKISLHPLKATERLGAPRRTAAFDPSSRS